MTLESLLVRLGRRGTLTITVQDAAFDVRFKAPGPYLGRAWCTTDEADFWSHCRLGAHDWHGEGPDLAALVTECEEESRPQHLDVEDLRWRIEARRESRTYGPPLPSYLGWRGWSPGGERWLYTSGHQYEYLDGYLRQVQAQHAHDAERAEMDRRRRQSQARRILGGAA